ncbi:MAG: hypothetical protein NXI31_01855 [bacterium]|nr:hypothetical protein [bacterium]
MNDKQNVSLRSVDGAAAERGTALILALIFTVVVLGIVLTGAIVLQSNRQQTKLVFARDAQAMQIARAGLTEARSWLNRQVSQPVVAFEPVRDLLSSPQVLDTIDPDIGIVREFQVAGQVWARYEVWKEWAADPDPVRAAKRAQWQCRDISSLRSASGMGAAWRLSCMGYVYERLDGGADFDTQPNRVIASQLLDMEVQRLILQIPGQAAVNVRTGGTCYINNKGQVIGGGTAAGIYYVAGSGTPSGGSRITGTPSLASTTTYDDSYETVFSVSLAELKAMASMVLSDLSAFPDPVPDSSLIVIDASSVTFDSSTPLKGNGIVVIDGNATIAAGSLSNFSGFLFVNGNFTMYAPSDIRGAVVTTGSMTVQGAADYSTITYDEDVLNTLRQNFGSYNISRAYHRRLEEEEN